jgi:phosphoglycolate phosphatase-like HAD superfamily hydrolase
MWRASEDEPRLGAGGNFKKGMSAAGRLHENQRAFMQKTSLILFDIDGTLLTSGGAGEHALRAGFEEEFGIRDDLRRIEISGRTDSGIALQMLKLHGIEVSAENLERFYGGYLRNLARELPARPGRLLPGIWEVLEALVRMPHVALGLLTGNLQDGARLKLEHYRVADFFPFGAFADDHHDRNELGRFALARAREMHGVEFMPQQVTVIGDTPHDISCARAVGARAVAVATGGFRAEQLAEHGPDVLLEDMGDLPRALEALQLRAH